MKHWRQHAANRSSGCDHTLTEIFGNRRRPQLVVRVALGFARHWLLDRLAVFARRHPNLPIRIVATVWASDPLDTSVDLDIRLASDSIPGMESHRLTHDEIFPVCTPQFANQRPRLRRALDLQYRPLLATIGFAQGWREWFLAAGIADDKERVGGSLEFDSMRLAVEMATLGHGVALARSSYCEDLVRARALKRLFDVRLKATDDLYLTHARGLEPKSPALSFRDWLLAAPRPGR